MEENGKEIVLLIGEERFVVNRKILSVSQFLKNLSEMFPNQEIPIQDKKITIEIMKKIVEYCEMHDYNPPAIAKPIKSGDLKSNLSDKDYDFIKNVSYTDEKELLSYIEAAIFFQIQSLQDVCIIRIATEFFIGEEEDGFEKLRKKHNIEQEMKLLDDYMLKEEFSGILKE